MRGCWWRCHSVGAVSMTPSTLWHCAAGTPAHSYTEEAIGGHCATCATPLTTGVALSHILTDTFTQHADFLRFGSHACPACAWLYGMGKGNPGSIIAAGDRYWRPMLSYDSATPERPQWAEVLRIIAAMPADTPVAGVLTPDPKPRLWPRAELCTVGAFGLYVHCATYDLSSFIRFDLADCLAILTVCLEAIGAGWKNKKTLASGLFADYQRAKKDPVGTARLEHRLAPFRANPAFIPALLMAGEPKLGNTTEHTDPAPTESNPPLTDCPERLQHPRRRRPICGNLPLFDAD